METKNMSRRNALNILLGVGGLLATGSALYPVISFLKPPLLPESTEHMVNYDKKFSELNIGDWSIFRMGDKPGILICAEIQGEKQVLAYSAICTHLACIVDYQPENRTFFCACHNGVYDVYGNNIAGPPPRPLDKFRTVVTNDYITILRS